MNRRENDAWMALQKLCSTYKRDAEHWSAEHLKLWTRNVDLVQRNKLLQEQVALQREIIAEKDERLARGIRAETLTQNALRKTG